VPIEGTPRNAPCFEAVPARASRFSAAFLKSTLLRLTSWDVTEAPIPDLLSLQALTFLRLNGHFRSTLLSKAASARLRRRPSALSALLTFAPSI